MLFRGDQFYLYIRWSDGVRRGCKIIFQKDGTIIVVLPTPRVSGGILATIQHEAEQGMSQACDLTHSGKVTRNIVKYSHHPDGRAHFSQDKKIYTKITRAAAPLAIQHGHLFSLILQRLDLFPIEPMKSGKRSIQLGCDSPTSRAVKFIASRHKMTGQGMIKRGHEEYLNIAPPSSYTLSNQYLCLVLREALEFDSAESPGLIFLGGFDDFTTASDPSRQLEFLAAAYPCSDYASLCAKIGSIDYPGEINKS